MNGRETNKKKAGSEVKTFSVPFGLGEIKGNISINTSFSPNPSKEQIINQAIKFHLKDNILSLLKCFLLNETELLD